MQSQALSTGSAGRSAQLTANDYALMVIRIGLAVVFIAHGAQKVFGAFGGPGLAGWIQGSAGLGIPAPLAYLAAFTELLGGIALLVGGFSRIAAIGIAITMAVATVKVHLPNGFFLAKMGYEYNLTLILMALAIAIAGPGRLALGDWEAKLLRR
jgi:putative oxidoreductase